MRIYRGESFLARFGFAKDLFPRDCTRALESYMSGSFRNHACVLYGLRRTGKSVLMFQSMLRRMDTSAYIFCSPEDTLDSLAEAMDSLWDEGVRNFFLDEVSFLPGFIDNGQFLADAYTGAGRVVMAGTDSLSFRIAENTSLSGRIVKIHTTRIPFREHAMLTRITDIDEYAEHGGILSKNEDFTRYPLRAIAFNIQNSLKYYESGERFLVLKPLYDAGLLTTAIQNVVRDMNHRFSREVIQGSWKLSDLTMARNSLHVPEARRFARKIRLGSLFDEVTASLGVVYGVRMTEDEVYAINRYLQFLDVVEPRLEIHENDIYPDTAEKRARTAKELSWSWRRRHIHGAWTFLQPGLRWAQVLALMEAVRSQIVLQKGFRDDFLNDLFAMIKSNAMGAMMEDIIVGETAASFSHEASVFKLKLFDGEIDMVILDKDSIRLFEIKHSTRADSAFKKHVSDSGVLEILEERFGKKVDFCGVIYRGETRKGFLNVSEYLSCLKMPDIRLGEEDESALDEGLRL